MALKTYNLDISGIADYMAVFRSEIDRMASISRFIVSEFDLGRMEQYIAVLQDRLDKVEPPMDLPKWHPTEISIPDVATNYAFDNKSVVNFLRKFDAIYHELTHSQSGDMPSGLQGFDKGRFQAGLDRLLLEIQHMKDTQEVDVPESATANS